jgi:hypothetical protein
MENVNFGMIDATKYVMFPKVGSDDAAEEKKHLLGR